MIFLLGSFIFIICLQPLLMVSLLILMTFLCSMGLFYYLGGFWSSYLVLLVVVSGVLVVFVYMACLVPNESFELVGLIFIGFMLGGLVCLHSFYMEGLMGGGLMMSLWGEVFSSLNLFLVMFLMGVMFMVVWFSFLSLGPIRVIFLNAWVKGLIW